jgi:hypothetical protein
MFDGYGTDSNGDRHKILLDNRVHFLGVDVLPPPSTFDKSSLHCIDSPDPSSNQCNLQGHTA